MNISRLFAHPFRNARRARGETQGDVASRMGGSQQLVSRVERGRAGFDLVVATCRALGLECRLVIGGESRIVVHAIDPDERREIEANLDWFSRLEPERRLKTIARQVRSLQALRDEVSRGRRAVRRTH